MIPWDGYHEVKQVPLIVVSVNRGKGVAPNLLRVVTQYWSLDGTLVAENDTYEVEARELIMKEFIEYVNANYQTESMSIYALEKKYKEIVEKYMGV